MLLKKVFPFLGFAQAQLVFRDT